MFSLGKGSCSRAFLRADLHTSTPPRLNRAWLLRFYEDEMELQVVGWLWSPRVITGGKHLHIHGYGFRRARKRETQHV